MQPRRRTKRMVVTDGRGLDNIALLINTDALYALEEIQ